MSAKQVQLPTDLKGKTVLVAGAAGFVPSTLAEFYLNLGAKVIGLDNFITGSQSNIDLLSKYDSFEFFECNIYEELPSFKNVKVKKNANIYFDGKVTSRTVEFEDGSIKTLGVMLPGEYTFNTADAEIMDINSGEFELKLPDSDKFVSMSGPCSFNVGANTSFDVIAVSVVDYCCSYIK